VVDANASDAAECGRIARFLEFVAEKQSIADFSSAFSCLFPYIHERGLTASYRLAKAPLKKIRHESAVLFHFLQYQNHYKSVRQNLGSGIPDAWLWTDNTCIDVEITVALAEMRLAIAERLNNFGESPGFITPVLGDDLAAYRSGVNNERGGYSIEQYVDLLHSSVIKRLRKKSISNRSGILLIDCPIGEEYASADMIDRLVDKIVPSLPPSGFESIFLVDRDRVAPLMRRS
jgi:hypothetical protein